MRKSFLVWLCVLSAVALVSPGPAEAHVDVHPQSAAAGDFELLHFVVYHGCDQSPTIKVSVKIPEGVVLVRPQVKPGWEISTVSGKYAEPLQTGDQTISEGFTEVTWSGGTVPPFYTDDFTILARLPSQERAVFLAQQFCEGNTEPLEFAPVVALRQLQDKPAQPAEPAASNAPSSQPAMILGGLGLLTGLVALAMALRRR